MSQTVPTPTPSDAEVEEGKSTAPHSMTDSACSCAKCGLYRWYPPLLLLSTIMAGVFCWMYVTKPVFLSQPRDVQPATMEAGFPGADPTGIPDNWEPPTAAVENRLDPDLGALPGEFVGTDEMRGPVEIRGSAPVAGLQALVVERDGPSLFKPFPAEGRPTSKEGEEVKVAVAGGERAADGEAAGSRAPAERFPSSGEAVLAGNARSGESGGGALDSDYGIGASFMTEFLGDGSPLGARPTN